VRKARIDRPALAIIAPKRARACRTACASSKAKRMRLGSARARTRVQGRRHRGGDHQTLHGAATLVDIVDDLAGAYSAPRDRVLADTTALLRGLADKKLLEL